MIGHKQQQFQGSRTRVHEREAHCRSQDVKSNHLECHWLICFIAIFIEK